MRNWGQMPVNTENLGELEMHAYGMHMLGEGSSETRGETGMHPGMQHSKTDMGQECDGVRLARDGIFKLVTGTLSPMYGDAWR